MSAETKVGVSGGYFSAGYRYKVNGDGWLYCDGKSKDSAQFRKDFGSRPGFEFEDLFVFVPDVVPENAIVKQVTCNKKDQSESFFSVEIHGKSYSRHGDMYRQWVDRRDPRSGKTKKVAMPVNDRTHRLIDKAIAQFLESDAALARIGG